MSRQYIYTIEHLTKKHGQREVLKDIWLAFYPGAKIGVLGRNGSGKSTLLRIMAGTDKDFDGEARLTDGFTAATCRKSRSYRPARVWDNLQEAIAPRRNEVDRYNEISMLLAEPMDDDKMQKLCDEMARLQDQIEATGRLGTRPRAGNRDGRDEPARQRGGCRDAFRRRAAARRAVQAAAQQARPAAARRADESSRRRER